MTYDMVTREGGHHATMEKMAAAINPLVTAGCPRSKIVVGIPAYGRHGKNPSQVQTYSEIVDAIISSSPDTTQGNIARLQSWKGILFDSPNKVREKVRYVLKQKMGGVFLWELGQDKQQEDWASGGILLHSAAREMIRVVSSSRSHRSGTADDNEL